MKPKQIMDALISLNPKTVYRKKNDPIVYVIFKNKAALFHACSKFIYINNERIK